MKVYSMRGYELVSKLRERVKLAEEIASKYSNGRVIGFISRVEPVEIGESKGNVAIEIPFDKYYESAIAGIEFPMGGLIGIVNPISLTAILGRIVNSRRADILSIAKVPTLTPVKDVTALLTPLVLYVELITECKLNEQGELVGEVKPARTPLEPQSPVFIPNPTYITKLLNLPLEGVDIGHLYLGGVELEGLNVRLPENTLYQHILVVGTTGSGKTVLLKNMVLSVQENLKEVNPLTLVFDLQGDYPHLVLSSSIPQEKQVYKPLDRITVILPITRDYIEYILLRAKGELGEVEDNGVLADIICNHIVCDFREKTYPDTVINKTMIDYNGDYTIRKIRLELTEKQSQRRIIVDLIPWSLEFKRIWYNVRNLLPYFTPQAYNFLPKIIDLLMVAEENTLKTLIDRVMRKQWEIKKKLGLHEATIEHIYRCLSILEHTGLFDVTVEYQSGSGRILQVSFTEPNYESLLGDPEVKTVVVDLRTPSLHTKSPLTQTIIVYRILEALFTWKDQQYISNKPLRPTIIFIDEAHNYFPQARGEINKDIVEALINRITRLGRVRKIGVVFATHRPSDLNNLIIQLVNTKIALRSEEETLKKVGLDKYKKELELAEDGVGVVKTPALRIHYITFKGHPPQTHHKG